MPDRCLSCGELAVIEDEIEGGSTQRICIECGTVATGVRYDKSSVSDIEGSHTNSCGDTELADDEHICESCGDTLPTTAPSDCHLCTECQQLETEETENKEQPSSEGACQQDNSEDRNDTAKNTSEDVCPSCGDADVGYESLGGDERLVCRNCGTVIGTEKLANDDFESMTRSYRNTFTTLPKFAERRSKAVGLTAGHEKITYLHSKFCFHDAVKTDALELYNKAYYHPRFFHAYVTTKQHVAAACVFIACRLHDIPVSLTHFKSHVDKFPLFVKVKKIVLRCLNMSLPHMTLSSQVGHLLVDRGFSSQVIEKVKDILFLCRNGWLTQGRSREGLIVIATYYAYLSSDMCTQYLSMPKFREKFQFPKLSVSLHAEIKTVFVKLASSIPWVARKNIKPNTIHVYINDILKYQNSLFQLAFRSQPSSFTQSTIHAHESGAGNFSGSRSEHENSEAATKCQKHRKRNSREKEKDILLPSALKKPRREYETVEAKIGPGVDLDSPDVTAAEFDEEEIMSYLLTEEEEANLKSLKLKAMNL